MDTQQKYDSNIEKKNTISKTECIIHLNMKEMLSEWLRKHYSYTL